MSRGAGPDGGLRAPWRRDGGSHPRGDGERAVKMAAGMERAFLGASFLGRRRTRPRLGGPGGASLMAGRWPRRAPEGDSREAARPPAAAKVAPVGQKRRLKGRWGKGGRGNARLRLPPLLLPSKPGFHLPLSRSGGCEWLAPPCGD